MELFWYCYESKEEDDFFRALHKFLEQMQSVFSKSPKIVLARLSEKEAVLALNRTTGGFLDSDALNGRRVVAYCAHDSAQAIHMRERESMAKWGATENRIHALIWTPNNKYLVWHETLHLLDAEDCYDNQGRPSCKEKRCVMQFDPNRSNCGDDLFLCAENRIRVQNCLESE